MMLCHTKYYSFSSSLVEEEAFKEILEDMDVNW